MIYLDYNATAPVDPAVAEVIAQVMVSNFGNPASSHHSIGNHARVVIEAAREQVAGALDIAANSIVWTSGATESLNLAIIGAVADMNAAECVARACVAAESVRDARQGGSRTAIARATGIPRPVLSDIEDASVLPSRQQLAALKHALRQQAKGASGHRRDLLPSIASVQPPQSPLSRKPCAQASKPRLHFQGHSPE